MEDFCFILYFLYIIFNNVFLRFFTLVGNIYLYMYICAVIGFYPRFDTWKCSCQTGTGGIKDRNALFVRKYLCCINFFHMEFVHIEDLFLLLLRILCCL